MDEFLELKPEKYFLIVDHSKLISEAKGIYSNSRFEFELIGMDVLLFVYDPSAGRLCDDVNVVISAI